ncbi:MAG: branched-chain amino acid ABC transporter permease [Bacillota bacterium]
MFIQQVIQGLAIGSVYGLMALGYALMWQAWAVLDFARGEAAMIGAFSILIFHSFFKIPFVVAFPLAIASSALLGYVIQWLAYRPLIGGIPINRLIATLGMGILLRNLARVIYGADPYPFPTVFGDKPVSIGNVLVVPQNVWITAIGFTLVILLRVFLTRTYTGKAMRAAAQDRETAALMGIRVKQSMALTFVLATGLGAMAGLLVAPVYFVRADMGLSIGLRGFASAVLGGLDSVTGAMVGGLLLGVTENLAAGYISSGYQAAIAFSIMILILIFRPQGIMGRRL